MMHPNNSPQRWLHRAWSLVIVWAVATMLPGAGWAQDVRTFNACFVPGVGALYLIGEPGLPPTCLSENHEQVTWTEGSDGTVTIEDGSVTTAMLADGAVTSLKIAGASVTGDKIANEAVTTDKIGASAITSTQLAAEAVTRAHIGAEAIGGNQIEAGSITGSHIASPSITGAHLLTNYLIVTSEGVNVAANSQATAEAACPSGSEVLGGGGDLTTGGIAGINIVRSTPGSNLQSQRVWFITVRNDTDRSWSFRSRAVCADIHLRR